MHHKNKSMKIKLSYLYGKGCFFERAKIKNKKIIKGYKKYIKKELYKGKKISKKITYHHLSHVSEGGKKSIENGSNLSLIAHQYIHSLKRDDEEEINKELRNFKFKIDMAKINLGDKDMSFTKLCELNPYFEDNIEIPAYDITSEIKLEYLKKEKYNRAYEKEKLQKEIKEYYNKGEER